MYASQNKGIKIHQHKYIVSGIFSATCFKHNMTFSG